MNPINTVPMIPTTRKVMETPLTLEKMKEPATEVHMREIMMSFSFRVIPGFFR